MLGALGGLAASGAMYPFLFLTTSMMGIPLDDLSIARGMAISDIDSNNYFNLALGIGMHLLTGVIAGGIFALAVSAISRFKITGFGKGIAEGVIFSTVVFMVLYVPTTIYMVQPNLSEIMHQVNPQRDGQQNQQVVENNLFPLYGFGFVAHVVFGVALGYLVSLGVLRSHTKTKG